MKLERAKEVVANARKFGSLNFNDEQKAEFKLASEVIHNHRMENDPSYKRRFRDCYNRLAVGIGRLDLAGSV